MSTPPDRQADSSASPAVPPPDHSDATAAPGDGGTAWQPRPSWATPTTADGIQVPGYEIQGELGRGGMGVVYLATNVRMKRPEVLKVVNKSLLDGNPGMAERFLREIQAAARLSHENVVKAYSARRRAGCSSSRWSTSRAKTWPSWCGVRGRCRWPTPVITFPRRRWACSTPTKWRWSTATSSRTT